MVTFILQSLFLIAAAFIVGAAIGAIARRLFPKAESAVGSSTRAADERLAAASGLRRTPGNDDVKKSAIEAAAMIPPAEPVPSRMEGARPSRVRSAQTAAAERVRHPRQNDKDRPMTLKNARRGKPDSLTAIEGIGTVIESKLFALGIFHYSQIAGWSAEQASWISDEIGFSGRAVRENWVGQAAARAKPAESKAKQDKIGKAAPAKKTAAKARAATAPGAKTPGAKTAGAGKKAAPRT
ncbi:MAG: hypothetical protein ACREIP_05000 [Alphaproteobacteria bacterium]